MSKPNPTMCDLHCPRSSKHRHTKLGLPKFTIENLVKNYELFLKNLFRYEAVAQRKMLDEEKKPQVKNLMRLSLCKSRKPTMGGLKGTMSPV
jgi:hypothetical protein